MGDRIAILKEGGVLAQYDTPENILVNPASDFVSSFVGGDRVLKRLSLTRVGDMKLEPANGSSDELPRLEEGWTLRDALSQIIGAGTDRGLVVAEDGGSSSRGTLSLDSIRKISHGSRDDSDVRTNESPNGDTSG